MFDVVLVLLSLNAKENISRAPVKVCFKFCVIFVGKINTDGQDYIVIVIMLKRHLYRAN